MTATIMTVDFRATPEHRQHRSGKLRDKIPTDQRPLTADGKLLTPRQVRARARRRMARAEIMSDQEMEVIFRKPIDEWDLEELARGRPRSIDGSFRGPKPKWITRAVHEQSMERFKAAVKSDMNATTVDAMTSLRGMIMNEEVDDKGKPIVPPSVKLDAAKFLLEHVVGKPKQQLEADVSVQLQSILAVVMANPAETLMSQAMGGAGYTIGHMPGITIPLGVDDVVDAEVVDDETEDDFRDEEAMYG